MYFFKTFSARSPTFSFFGYEHLSIYSTSIPSLNLTLILLNATYFLVSRDFNSSIVDCAIYRANAIPREVALKKVEKKEKPDQVIFHIFNPHLPCIYSIIQKHRRTMV